MCRSKMLRTVQPWASSAVIVTLSLLTVTRAMPLGRLRPGMTGGAGTQRPWPVPPQALHWLLPPQALHAWR